MDPDLQTSVHALRVDQSNDKLIYSMVPSGALWRLWSLDVRDTTGNAVKVSQISAYHWQLQIITASKDHLQQQLSFLNDDTLSIESYSAWYVGRSW